MAQDSDSQCEPEMDHPTVLGNVGSEEEAAFERSQDAPYPTVDSDRRLGSVSGGTTQEIPRLTVSTTGTRQDLPRFTVSSVGTQAETASFLAGNTGDRSNADTGVNTTTASPASAANRGRRDSTSSLYFPAFTRAPARHSYTCHEYERTVYDIDCHTNGPKRFLHEGGLMEEEGELSPGLVRCLLDVKVRVVDLLMIATVYATSIIAPFTFIFGGSWEHPEPVLGGRTTIVCDVVLDVLYFLYMVWSLNVSILDPLRHVELVCRVTIVSQHLLSLSFWVRLASVTPYFWISVFRAPLSLNSVKICRLLHVYSLPDSLWKHREGSIVQTLRLVSLFLVGAHWTASYLGYFGGFREVVEAEGWQHFETHFYGRRMDGRLSLYAQVLVEAMALISGSLDNPLGEGDSARNGKFGALVLVALMSFMSIFLIALLLSTVVREHGLSRSLVFKHEENKAFMVRALQTLNIPHGLQQRVFTLHYFQRLGHDREAFEALFNKKNLSPTLEVALRVYLYHDNVLCSPYFVGRDVNYVLEIIRVLHDESFLPGDYVVRRGELGSSMYFVVRGKLSILVPVRPSKRITGRVSHHNTISQCQPIRDLHAGDFFGEVALVKGGVRSAWVRADTFVRVASITREDLRRIWKHFPSEQRAMVERVHSTVRKDEARAHMSAVGRSASRRFRQVGTYLPDPASSRPTSGAALRTVADKPAGCTGASRSRSFRSIASVLYRGATSGADSEAAPFLCEHCAWTDGARFPSKVFAPDAPALATAPEEHPVLLGKALSNSQRNSVASISSIPSDAESMATDVARRCSSQGRRMSVDSFSDHSDDSDRSESVAWIDPTWAHIGAQDPLGCSVCGPIVEKPLVKSTSPSSLEPMEVLNVQASPSDKDRGVPAAQVRELRSLVQALQERVDSLDAHLLVA